jgi:hypothetical protein
MNLIDSGIGNELIRFDKTLTDIITISQTGKTTKEHKILKGYKMKICATI